MESNEKENLAELLMSLPTKKPTKGISFTQFNEAERTQVYQFWDEYNVESWYSQISGYTFKTVISAIPKEIAEIFASGPFRDTEKYQILPIMVKLQNEIDQLITKLVEDYHLPSRKVFIRLSTRSPKDALLLNESLIDNHILQPLVTHITDWNDKNEIAQVIWVGMAKGMAVTSGREAIQLCLQSSRVRDDCLRFLERGEDYAMNIIIREWVDIPIRYEFRAFITHKRINCISQYFNNCYFKDVVTNKDLILTGILSLWEEVKEKLSFNHGIVDFALSEDLMQAYIIECNPLDILTGPALFDYTADWEIITGTAPFEFRIVSELNERLMKELDGTYYSFLPEINKAIKIQEMKREEEKIEKEKNQKCSIM